MTDFDQKAVDKAHGALGMAARVAASARDAQERAEARLARAKQALDDAERICDETQAAVADADAELAVRESDPLLNFPSSHGDDETIIDATADPALGTGGN